MVSKLKQKKSKNFLLNNKKNPPLGTSVYSQPTNYLYKNVMKQYI